MEIGKKEASCRGLQVIHEYLLTRGISLDNLYEGLPISLADTSRVDQLITWNEFAAIQNRAAHLIGSLDECERLGFRAVASDSMSDFKARGLDLIARLAGLIASVDRVYSSLMNWYGPYLFKPLHFSYEKVNDHRARLVIEIPPQLDGSLAFFYIWLGGFKGLPRFFNQPEAVVRYEITSHRAVYDIDLPPTRTLLIRMKYAWRAFFGVGAVVQIIEGQQRELKEYYAELQEGDSKLKLSSRIVALSSLAALGDMAGGIAHELNNPLMIIHGRVKNLQSLAEAGRLDQETFRIEAEKLDATVFRMAEIIKSLRAISRDAGDDPFLEAPVQRIIEDALRLCTEKFRNAGIDLKTPQVPDTLLISCRPTQISQVLLNLLNNAYDAVVQEKVKWVRLEVLNLSNAVQISLENSGDPIPERVRTKLFQPFFTTKELGRGTGLNLSSAKGLIELHQGSLSCSENEPHTRFVILLPKVRSEILRSS